MQTKNPYLSTFHNNPQEFYATKIHKHKVCGYSLFTHCSFDRNGNKYDFYRGEDPMKKLSAARKKMFPLTKKQERKNKKQKIYCKCSNMFNKNENYHRVRDRCHYTENY